MPPRPLKIIIQSNYNLVLSAQNDPATIDDLLPPILAFESDEEKLEESSSNSKSVSRPRPKASKPKPKPISLIKYLEDFIAGYIVRPVTPELQWGGDPSRDSRYYRKCFVGSVLIGRAYSLLWENPSRDTPGHKARLEELWKIMQDIFIKGLFSGKDPEPGSRFSAGYLILTCSKALEASEIKGKGKGWVFWAGDSYSRPDEEWTWDDLRNAIFETKDLPRNTSKVKNVVNTDIEYVPEEVLKVMDRAREHLGALQDRQDLTSSVVTQFFGSY